MDFVDNDYIQMYLNVLNHQQIMKKSFIIYELIRELTSSQLKLTPAKSKSVTEAPRG